MDRDQQSRAPLFQNLSADNNEVAPTEIESLCMQCHEQGLTRLLLTRIPHFRDIVIIAFECPHCGFKNNELQSAEALSEFGIEVSFQVKTKNDLNRQVIKTTSCVVTIPEWEFEIPAGKSSLTTIEGMIQSTIEDLSMDQSERDPQTRQVIAQLLAKMEASLQSESPQFSLILNDPAGQSYVEHIPQKDSQITIKHYKRNAEQMEALGFAPEQDILPVDKVADALLEAGQEAKENQDSYSKTYTDLADKEIYEFPSNCPTCHVPCQTRMHLLDIPHFKQVVIMSTSCDSCGYKSNEVKSGGAVSVLGKKITLSITTVEDMSRDILKSETCQLEIPELDFCLHAGTLGGRFTTLEGLLTQVMEELSDRTPFLRGDSVTAEQQTSFRQLIDNLTAITKGDKQVTLILDDPLANSYLQNLYAPDEDPEMKIEEYERTFEQNEDLGLNDMKVENYEEENETMK